MYNKLKKQMREFYFETEENKETYYAKTSAIDIRKRIFDEMDEFYKKEKNQFLLKSHIHSLIAEYFEPQIFTDSPFFFEMGLRHRDSWGMCHLSPAKWMKERVFTDIVKEHPLTDYLEKTFYSYFDRIESGLCSIDESFDDDHHTLGYTILFDEGINGIYNRAESALKKESNPEKKKFYQAVCESLNALVKISNRFGEKAQNLLESVQTKEEKTFLKMIIDTTKHIPAEPPKTFYEGLAMLLFTRETIATLEDIGVSQFGLVDRLLGDLYEKDISEGRLTEDGAKDLLKRWMIYTDIKFDLENNFWPETSTCIQLGGCDEEGEPVYNNVTRIFIEAHKEAGLVNPKLNCRYAANSPKEYIRLIGSAVLAGHNNFVLINDDIVINGLLKSGVDIKDARRYVSGGCQETMIEGCGHTEGAGVYMSMPRMLDLYLRPDSKYNIIKSVGAPENFESFYSEFLETMKGFMRFVFDRRNVRQSFNKACQGRPLFSATQRGCIESGMDYTEGGAKYNFSTVALVGLGTMADSLYAVKTLVYDRKVVTLTELIKILEDNWEGHADIHKMALSLPKYAQNNEEVDALANRFLKDVSEFVRSVKNERGGNYIPSLFVYYYFEYFSRKLRATPDGRKYGDLMSMGCGPSRIIKNGDITKPLKTMKNVDFTNCGGGSSVLDVQLPLSSNMTPDIFASFVYACASLGCPTLQPNVVSVEELKDAKINPHNHKNLIVRISGLSAYFTALDSEVQDEIIERVLYNV